MKSPHLQVLRVNQISCSSTTSSNTTSMNSRFMPCCGQSANLESGCSEGLGQSDSQFQGMEFLVPLEFPVHRRFPRNSSLEILSLWILSMWTGRIPKYKVLGMTHLQYCTGSEGTVIKVVFKQTHTNKARLIGNNGLGKLVPIKLQHSKVNICIYIYIYMRVCVYIYIYTHVCIHIGICIYNHI